MLGFTASAKAFETPIAGGPLGYFIPARKYLGASVAQSSGSAIPVASSRVEIYRGANSIQGNQIGYTGVSGTAGQGAFPDSPQFPIDVDFPLSPTWVPLTGSVATSLGNATVAGTGTLFLAEIMLGTQVWDPVTNQRAYIDTLSNNTSMTVDTAFPVALVAGTILYRNVSSYRLLGTNSSSGVTVTNNGTAGVPMLALGHTVVHEASGQSRRVASVSATNTFTTDTPFNPVLAGGSILMRPEMPGITVRLAGSAARAIVLFSS